MWEAKLFITVCIVLINWLKKKHQLKLLEHHRFSLYSLCDTQRSGLVCESNFKFIVEFTNSLNLPYSLHIEFQTQNRFLPAGLSPSDDKVEPF